MKKALSLILALVMCLSLCACGGEKTDAIQLTMENYKQYINVEAWASRGEEYEADKLVPLGFIGSTGYEATEKVFYTSIAGCCSIEGLSTNFNYQDVKVTVRFTGDVVIYDMNCDPDTKQLHPFTFDGVFSTDIAGNDVGDRTHFDMPENKMAFVEHRLSSVSGLECTFEIIDVSGTVIPA